MKTILNRTLLAVLLLAGCTAAQRIAAEKRVATAVIDDEQELQLGLQVHEQLLKENVKFYSNPQVDQYVLGLARKLEAQTASAWKGTWQWYLIDDAATVNAFATPGGRIYLYTGLILSAESEAELVGVLGHEMGHVVNRHSARQLVSAHGLQSVLGVVLGKEPSMLATVAAELAGKGALLAYGRGMELEADELGLTYASAASYDPRGLVTFFDKLRAKGDVPAFLSFLSTHPSNDERISKATAYIAAQGLTGSERGVASLKAIQAVIGQPAPGATPAR